MPPAEADSLTEQFFEFLSVEKNVSPRTLDNYERALETFRAWLGKEFSHWNDCNADHFRAYLFDCMKRELARSTIRLHFAALRGHNAVVDFLLGKLRSEDNVAQTRNRSNHGF